jgi:hypothetical protein
MVETVVKALWAELGLNQFRPAGMERGTYRRYTWAGGYNPDDGHIQPLSQASEGHCSPLWGAIVAHVLEQLRREGVGNLVERGALLPHLVELGQSRGVTHALKMSPIAQLPLSCCGDPLAEGIAHSRPGKGPPGHLRILVHADADILDNLHMLGVPVDPPRAFGDTFTAPGDLLWRTPIQTYPIGQLASEAEHLRP